MQKIFSFQNLLQRFSERSLIIIIPVLRYLPTAGRTHKSAILITLATPINSISSNYFKMIREQAPKAHYWCYFERKFHFYSCISGI
ncbi:hypothetical protein A8C56_21585 [Niabella ginsenosidivorans]|uniref:Uncharacterized protein n=1 Tax=Niabella ginsenosidivorans TaxID=1176587 RepID=A0A1A9I943_9BACT|nr:hypothetical protein A8C56_21585 [Niabella ginsenosidivorans]